MSKPPSIRTARTAIRYGTEEQRQHVLEELGKLAASEITDVLFWDNEGRVTLTQAADLSPRARAAIKKVKVTPTPDGNHIEVELHDKMPALRLLSKHHGLLDGTNEQNKPSVIGINLQGPAVTTYEVKDDTGDNSEAATPRGGLEPKKAGGNREGELQGNRGRRGKSSDPEEPGKDPGRAET
jgi:hypothetical protein